MNKTEFQKAISEYLAYLTEGLDRQHGAFGDNDVLSRLKQMARIQNVTVKQALLGYFVKDLLESVDRINAEAEGMNASKYTWLDSSFKVGLFAALLYAIDRDENNA